MNKTLNKCLLAVIAICFLMLAMCDLKKPISDIPKDIAKILHNEVLENDEIKSQDKMEEIAIDMNEESHNQRSEELTSSRDSFDEIVEEKDAKVDEKSNLESPKEEPQEKREVETKMSEPVLQAAEQMPQFPGGDAELAKWLRNNIQYPISAKENRVEGRVIVKFVVKKDGSIGEIKIVKSAGYDFDDEARRLVNAFPNFIPGKMNGQPVNVWFILPVTFKLQ